VVKPFENERFVSSNSVSYGTFFVEKIADPSDIERKNVSNKLFSLENFSKSRNVRFFAVPIGASDENTFTIKDRFKVIPENVYQYG